MRAKIGVGFASVGEAEKRFVNLALDAGRLSAGKFVYQFERQFAALHGCAYGVACNSGTSALHVALEVLKEKYSWQNGAEVLVPAITFIATSNACIHTGLTPVFVDVDPISYNMNPQLLQERATSKTVAIIPVHTFGQPCDMEPIVQFAKQRSLAIIEDCAESHFATYRGKPVGSFGEFGCFSTYVAHTISTGVGGVIVTNNSEGAEVCRSLVAHGRACTCERCIASDPSVVCKLRQDTDIDKRFMMVRLGYSYRIGEMEGAIGLGQLENKQTIMQSRLENAAYLSQRLSCHQDYLQLPIYPSHVSHSFMMYPIVLTNKCAFKRKRLTEWLESSNIETRPMLPLLNQPIYLQLFGDLAPDYPVANWINHNGFYIGCHHGLQVSDLEYVCNTFDKFFDEFV